MRLTAGPDTCHWGFFDAALPPVLTIESGSEVTIDTVSGTPHVLPGKGFHVPPELLALHAQGVPAMPGHILTSPVAVAARCVYAVFPGGQFADHPDRQPGKKACT
jgi:acetamidase/formamidase